MKRLSYLLVMQAASLLLALMDVLLWPPRSLVFRVENVRDWAFLKLQNMEDDDAS